MAQKRYEVDLIFPMLRRADSELGNEASLTEILLTRNFMAKQLFTHLGIEIVLVLVAQRDWLCHPRRPLSGSPASDRRG